MQDKDKFWLNGNSKLSDIPNLIPRKEQIEMVSFCKESIIDNKKKVIMIDAPVGIGKSIFAIMFMDWYKNNYDPGAQYDVLTNSKLLQEQYTREFTFMDSLWGKDNYRCNNFDCSCSTGKEMSAALKRSCNDCPYDIARENFFNGDVSLTNFHLFLTYKMLNPNAWKRKARVLIVDECLHPDSLITMSDNSKKKIKDLQVGESVKTVNENTGIIENKPIEKVHFNLNKGKQMYELEMEDGSILKITGNHKVYLSNKTWVKVEDLKGDEDILYIE